MAERVQHIGIGAVGARVGIEGERRLEGLEQILGCTVVVD